MVSNNPYQVECRDVLANSKVVIPEQVAKYFDRLLRRGQLESVDFEGETYVSVEATELVDEKLAEEEAAILFAAHDRAVSRSRRLQAKSKDSIPVAMSLVSLDTDEGYTGLLLLEATLHRDGRLEANLATDSSPWIPSRRLRSPTVSGHRVMVGTKVPSLSPAVSIWERVFAWSLCMTQVVTRRRYSRM